MALFEIADLWEYAEKQMIRVWWVLDDHNHFGRSTAGTEEAGNVELAGKVGHQNQGSWKLHHQSIDVQSNLSWEVYQDQQVQVEQCQAFDIQDFDIAKADLEQEAETSVGEVAVFDHHRSIGNNQVEYTVLNWQKQDLLEVDQVQEISEWTHKADTVQHQGQALLKVDIAELVKTLFENESKQAFQNEDNACGGIQVQETQ